MAESHHRIKNNFQMLSALLDMQIGSKEEGASLDDYRKLSLHIRALASIHDLLTEQVKTSEVFERIDARSSLEKLLPLLRQTLEDRPLNAFLTDLALPMKEGAALLLLVSELVSNAIKHGRGEISLTLTVSEGTAQIEVRDQGPGFPEGFDTRTSAHNGFELVESLARHDLRGESLYENLPAGGGRVTILFPIP